MFTTTLITAVLAGGAPSAAPAPTPAPQIEARADDAVDQVKTIKDEFAKAQKDARDAFNKLREGDEWKAAMEAGDRAKLQEMYESTQPDPEAYVARFMELAGKHEGKPAEALALQAAYDTTQDPDTTATALEGLIARHLDNDALWEEVTMSWFMVSFKCPARFDQFTDQVAENSKSKLVQAQAYYGKAQAIEYSAPRGQALDEASQKEVDSLKARVLELAPDSIAALEIDGPRFEEARLQIGMVAPDIAGDDTSGEAFKLSDYRGKVVVLDFWGDW